MTALLLAALRDIGTVARLDPPGWNRLLLAARHHRLLARLAEELALAGMAETVPPPARRQLAAAQGVAAANQAALRFEIARVRAALAGRGFPVALLKGGAYLAAGLAAARGRVAVDLDLLVPRSHLGEAERALLEAGWRLKPTDAYDDHYYRAWMHELPPFEHPEREMSLDLHHTIFPPVSGMRISGAELLAHARPLEGGLCILQPADLVLHAALHLFGEDTAGRLRDLVDLRDLLAEAVAAAGWESVLRRAAELQALWALDHAFEHLGALLGVAVPPAIRAGAAAARRPWWRLSRAAIGRSLLGQVPGETPRFAAAARRLVFIRSHWLRMPPLLLARHLWVKAQRRRQAARR